VGQGTSTDELPGRIAALRQHWRIYGTKRQNSSEQGKEGTGPNRSTLLVLQQLYDF